MDAGKLQGIPLDVRDEQETERVCDAARYVHVGRCVSSITHEVNNYLGAIMAYAELVSLEEGLSKESKRMLDEVIGAVRKSSDLVGSLTDVARTARVDIRLMSPSKVAGRVLDIMRYDLKVARITIGGTIDAHLGAMRLDVPVLQTGLIALVANAIDASTGENSPMLDFDVRLEGEGVLFRIANGGSPIPEEDRPHIFEPFWTTKEQPHLGLGLSLAQRAADIHGGTLAYDAEEGFLLHIPKNGIQ